MTRRWGEGEEAGSAERRADGRFRRSMPCDACGLPCGDLRVGEWYTDEEVCGGSDGPGFYLCRRRVCMKKRDLPVEERRGLYEAQRAVNQRDGLGLWTPGRPEKKPKPVSTAACLRVLDGVAPGEIANVSLITTLVAPEDAGAVAATMVRFGRFAAEDGGTCWRRVM